MENYLFAYGTLREGLAPPEIAATVELFTYVGAGYSVGRLYDLGAYSGAVFDDTAELEISGQVFALPEDDGEVLSSLDDYEGFNPNDFSDSLFVRKEINVTLETGEQLPCWAYEYNGNTPTATAKI